MTAEREDGGRGVAAQPVMGYALRYEVIDGACFVELPGDADLYGASEIRARISAFIASPERLVLDLSNLSITDETQLRVLLCVTARARQLYPDRAVVLVVPDENSRRKFEITGLDRFFSPYPSRGEALAALGSAEDRLPSEGDQRDRVTAAPPSAAIEPPPTWVEPRRDRLESLRGAVERAAPAWEPEDVRQRLLDELRYLSFMADAPGAEEAAWQQAHFTVLVTELPSDDERLVRLARAGGPGSVIEWSGLFFCAELSASDMLNLIVLAAESAASGGHR